MRNLKNIFTVWALVLLSTSAIASEPVTNNVEAVWQHHIAAWGERNLDKIVSDYTDNSIMIVNGQVFTGQAEIRKVFARLFDIFDAGKNKIDPVVLVDRIVYITWHFEPTVSANEINREEFYGTDTFVIEDGKIAVQTIASPLYGQFLVDRK